MKFRKRKGGRLYRPENNTFVRRAGDAWVAVVDGVAVRAAFQDSGAALAAIPVERRRRAQEKERRA